MIQIKLKILESVVPQEYHYIINPNHFKAEKIKMIGKTALIFD